MTDPCGSWPRNSRYSSRSWAIRIACPACPCSLTATNTEYRLCASHPINCCILLQHLLSAGVLLAVYAKPHCSAFIASVFRQRLNNVLDNPAFPQQTIAPELQVLLSQVENFCEVC